MLTISTAFITFLCCILWTIFYVYSYNYRTGEQHCGCQSGVSLHYQSVELSESGQHAWLQSSFIRPLQEVFQMHSQLKTEHINIGH